MSDFQHIEILQQDSDENQVTIVEVLSRQLWGPTIMQELVQELSSLLEQAEYKDILLNLRQVEYISSAALNRLINFHKRVQSAGGKLKLCCLRPSIEEIFITTRFNQLVDIHQDEEEALAAY
jgi:anti-sigma B factor antagonist